MIDALSNGTPLSNQPEVQRWVIDSIEESVASIEVDGNEMITLPQASLPRGVRQGDVLRVTTVVHQTDDGETHEITVTIDEEATKSALADSATQVEKHAKQFNDPGGDIVL